MLLEPHTRCQTRERDVVAGLGFIIGIGFEVFFYILGATLVPRSTGERRYQIWRLYGDRIG